MKQISNTRSLRPIQLVASFLFYIACLNLFEIQPAAGASGNLNTDQAVSATQIEAARKAAEADSALDETGKQKALEFYDQAAQWLKQSEDTKAQLARLESQLRDAPQRIESIRNGKAKPEREMPGIDPVLKAGDLEQIDLALSQEQLALQQAREAQRKRTDELTKLLVGSKGLSEEISTGTKTLEQIDTQLQAVLAGESSTVSQARALMLRSSRMLRQLELELLKLRLGKHDLLTNLTQAERDLLGNEIKTREQRFSALTQAAQKLREDRVRQARQEAEDLKSRTEALPEALRLIAEENARYRLELEELISREQSVSGDLQEARLGLDDVKDDFERTRQRVDVVGPTEAIGKMLERRRNDLPSLQKYRRTSALRGAEIGQATDRQIEIEELLRERSDIQSVSAKVLEGLPETEQVRFEPETIDLVNARRDALNELQKVYSRYIGQITSLDLAERQLVEVAGAYIDYIDDKLIWIPGAGIAALADPAGLGRAIAWLLAPRQWVEVARDVSTVVLQRPLRVAAILVLFVLLLKKQRGSLNQIKEIARETRKIRTDSFRLTLQALFFTLTAIAAWPVLLIGAGWSLGSLPTAAPFSVSIANGLIKAGLILVAIRFLMQVSLPDGIGDRHLRWQEPVREALIREFGWLLPIALPLGFLVAATTGNDSPQAAQTLGRAAFIALMAVSAVFVYRLLRRRGAMMEAATGENGGGPLVQLHFLWFPLLVILPVAYAITSAVGYHHTALHLEQRAEQTFWFFVGLFLVKELLLRSLYIAERRLRFDDALRRRDELREQRAQGIIAKDEEAPLISLDIPEVDFAQLNDQNKRLVRAGFLFGSVIGIWSIWSDLLPALAFLNETELPFHASRIVDGVAKEVPVTLGDLTIGLIMVIITILAAKNIPGVLEITLLQRLPLDSGARYAITSLSRYTIAGIGVFIAFRTLGLQWSSIQWLVAALSVGLGFGLQEIVANFISGIILLFERPIRVGDVVTIDGTTGIVSRIRIRATTITNWDKQELLIPNKEFITGRVINWTLTDKTNRIVITVGVAYGSDVEKALALMLEAAEEDQNVLEDPKPIVSFEGFGDNALTLLLRAYLGSMDNRLATITALHKAINEKFNAAEICIAFPQRDVHLDTTKPLDIRLHKPPA